MNPVAGTRPVVLIEPFVVAPLFFYPPAVDRAHAGTSEFDAGPDCGSHKRPNWSRGKPSSRSMGANVSRVSAHVRRVPTDVRCVSACVRRVSTRVRRVSAHVADFVF